MATVEMIGVGKSYGAVQVIEDFNLKVDDGAFTVFVGPSGCGKSTLLRMIAGLENITRGDVQISGRRVNDADPIERGVAMVFQNYALYPHMNVEQNIGFSLRMARLGKADIAKRVRETARTLQIEELLDRKPAQLSGGQRQRVAIGRAIVRDPGVFLFDEPLSNLDAELRVSMRVEIAKLHHKLGSTMIYVTHDQTEAMTLADRIVVMRQGAVEQAGAPDELYENPDNLFVAGFIGSPKMNFFRARLIGETVHIGDGATLDIPGLAGSGDVIIGVRPEHFLFGSGDAEVEVKVDVVENLGGTRYVYGTLSSGEAMVIEDRDLHGFKSGDVISAGISAGRSLVFDSNGKRIRPGN
jgi:lactose/L-arabinose transport system ATP-binding protein